MVTSRTQHDPVAEIGPATAIPRFDVVSLAMLGWGVTLGASAVPLQQSDPLGPGKHPFAAPQIEDFTVAAEDLRDHTRITRKPTQLAYRNRLINTVNTAKALACHEVTLIHAHDNRGPHARLRRLSAPQRMPAHLVERIGTHLPHGALVRSEGIMLAPCAELLSHHLLDHRTNRRRSHGVKLA